MRYRFFATCVALVTFWNSSLRADELNAGQEILHLLEECDDSLFPAQEKTSGAFVWFTGIPHVRFNKVAHLVCADEEVEKCVGQIIMKAPKGLPLSFWHHPLNQAKNLPEILQAKGFKLFLPFPGMLWHVQPIKIDSQLEVREAEDLDQFNDILAATLHYNDAVKEGFAKILSSPYVEHYMVYIDKKAVGTGTLWHKGKKGVIMNVMILPDYQKRGAGKAISEHLMQRAYQLGLKHVVLRSSPAAEKLYTNLGFKKAYEIEVYIRPN